MHELLPTPLIASASSSSLQPVAFGPQAPRIIYTREGGSGSIRSTLDGLDLLPLRLLQYCRSSFAQGALQLVGCGAARAAKQMASGCQCCGLGAEQRSGRDASQAVCEGGHGPGPSQKQPFSRGKQVARQRVPGLIQWVAKGAERPAIGSAPSIGRQLRNRSRGGGRQGTLGKEACGHAGWCGSCERVADSKGRWA